MGQAAGGMAEVVCAMPNIKVAGSGGATVDAYLAAPSEGSGPWPGVVVVHDIFGLTRHARDHVDRLASYGYVAVAPDLYTRGGMARCVVATLRSMMSGEGKPYEELETVRVWLTQREDCTDRVGIIGFCMGGGFALMTASRGFDVAAPNYGNLPKDLSVLDGACPVVGSYGGKDFALRGAAAKLESALAARNIPRDIKEYPGAGHSFLDRFPVGPLAPLARVTGLGYNQPAADDAWQRIEDFFAEHLR
jgi:carboxymethylenebutenolidase